MLAIGHPVKVGKIALRAKGLLMIALHFGIQASVDTGLEIFQIEDGFAVFPLEVGHMPTIR